jgi:protein-disulfide isomerase
MASQKPGKDNFTRNLVVVVVIGVVLLMLVPTVISKQAKTSAKIPATVTSGHGYGIVFNKDVKSVPVIDIFEDFQCPVCKEFEKLNGDFLESLIKEKKATVVYHALSFIGVDSVRAANAAACSADEGKFLDFHRAAYANQPAENTNAWTNEALVVLGKAAGISSKKYSTCVMSGQYANWVNNVADFGAKANINSTPTILVNGKQIDRKTEYFDADKFKAAIARG